MPATRGSSTSSRREARKWTSAGEREWLFRRLALSLHRCGLAEFVDVALEVAELECAQQLAELRADQA
jgi:hypothetical protein